MSGRVRAGAVVAIALVTTLAGVHVAAASNDPDFATFQYGPQQIYAPEAWTVTRGEGVTIAVVDSGVQLDHPDLRDKIVAGYDFYEDDADPSDDNGHGTHVAGIAAAVTDNGVGIAGVAPDAKIMPIRVLGGEATGSPNLARSLLALQQAVDFAANNGAKVINLSLGEEGDPLGPEGFDRLSNACRDAYNRGSLCVATAGNRGRGQPSGYGHDFPGIVVAANDRNREIASFSQRADTQWSVTAPGVAVHSTWIDSGYRFENGTSMAAPHVAGVAALLFAQGHTIQEVVDRILTTATPLNDGGGESGAGLVNAAAAVGAAWTPATTAPPAQPTATTAVPAPGGGTRPVAPDDSASASTVPAPVDLAEGVVEDDEDFDAASRDEGFLVAGDLGDEAEPITLSRGFEAPFLLGVGLFVAALVVLGLGARRLVVRRGIGEIRT